MQQSLLSKGETSTNFVNLGFSISDLIATAFGYLKGK